jgi:hypothetical protein
VPPPPPHIVVDGLWVAGIHTRSSCTALRLCTVTPLTHGAYVVCAGDAIFAATVECVLGLRASLLQLQRT